jgi:hypothetical protein
MGWWKILAGNLRRHAAAGMEATLLCCPSCPQRFVQAGRSAPDHDGRAVARRQARFRQHRARRMPCRRLDGMLGIRSDRERGLGRHLEQAIVDCRFVLVGDIGRSDQAAGTRDRNGRRATARPCARPAIRTGRFVQSLKPPLHIVWERRSPMRGAMRFLRCSELPGKMISMRRIWVQHPNRGPNSHPSPAIGASRR